MNYSQLGQQIGSLCDTKNAQYGSSFSKTADYLRILYPDGIQPSQYTDLGLLFRMFDKQMRIANGHSEDSYDDLAGYALLGAKMNSLWTDDDVLSPPPLPLTVAPEDILPVDEPVYYTYDGDTDSFTQHPISDLDGLDG